MALFCYLLNYFTVVLVIYSKHQKNPHIPYFLDMTLLKAKKKKREKGGEKTRMYWLK